jgi:hypothetical protein
MGADDTPKLVRRVLQPKPAGGKESGVRPHSLAPKGEFPIRTSVRIVQCNDQAALTSTVAAGARLRLNRVRQPFSRPKRLLQHRALTTSRIIQENKLILIVKQRSENPLISFRSNQRPIVRVVQMIGAFMIVKEPGESHFIHAGPPVASLQTLEYKSGSHFRPIVAIAIVARSEWSQARCQERRICPQSALE